MFRFVKVVLLLLAWLAPHSLFAALPEGVEQHPEPEWIDPVDVDVSGLAQDDNSRQKNGMSYLLYSRQYRLSQRDKNDSQSYQKIAYQIRDIQSVQDYSHISLSFRPAYQALALHTLAIWRDGERIDAMDRARYSLLQRESGAEQLIYNGEKDLDIVLSDVRVGDIVEYSYSRYGSNPVFGGATEIVFPVSFSVGIENVHYKVQAPAGRKLDERVLNASERFVVGHEKDASTYRLQFSASAEDTYEDYQPAWYSSERYIVLSDMRDWADVAEWERALYENAVSAGLEDESLVRLAKQLSHDAESDDEYIVKALQWVQDEIRYLALTIGHGTHKPSSPVEVLDRRFGDCKDKSVLLMTLLKYRGIEAHAALVNTETGDRLESFPQRLHAFDHAIVSIPRGDETLWLDPTKLYQRGSVGEFVQPDYGSALVLKPGARSLTSMRNNTATSIIKVVNAVSFPAGKKGPAELEVSTELFGPEMESQRATFQSRDKQDILADYVDYYANRYGDTEAISDIAYVDSGQGVIEIRERYALHELDGSGGDCDCFQHVYPDYLVSYMSFPEENVDRVSPHALTHPVQLEESFEITVPYAVGKWNDRFAVDSEYFDFSGSVVSSPDESLVTVTYFYESKVDHVAAKDLPEFIDEMNKVEEYLGYQIGTHKVAAGVALLERFDDSNMEIDAELTWTIGVFFFLWVTALIYRWRTRPVQRHA